MVSISLIKSYLTTNKSFFGGANLSVKVEFTIQKAADSSNTVALLNNMEL